MTHKAKLKIRPVLVALNILVLIVITSFYGIRMYKYYKMENAVVKNEGDTTFLSILKNKQSMIDLSKGLVYDEKTNTYSYKGKVEDNYLLYSGILFRIVGIDTSDNIKLVSDKNLTLMYSGLDKGYNESYIYKWMNKSEEVEYSGVFESVLYDKDSFLTKSIICEDIISDLKNVSCDNKSSTENYSLLSLYDYVTAGSNESYLNNGESYYLRTYDDKGNNYYVISTGEIGVDNVSTKIHGVRVVLSVKSDFKLIGGTGIKDNPYVIEEHDIKTLKDAYVGDIVSYSDMNWKIIDKADNSVKLALNDALKSGEEYLSKTFGGTSNKYSLTKNTIGAYLNDTFYKSLENKEYIVKSNWYTGANTISNLDYASKYKSSVSTNLGMLSLSELFVEDIKNTLTITPGIELSTIITVINENNNAFGDSVATKYNVRPSVYLKNDIEVNEGNGTADSPYIINESNEMSGE